MSTSSQIVDVEDNEADKLSSSYDGDESGGSAKEEHLESSDDDDNSEVKREIQESLHKTTFHSVKQPLAEQSRFKEDYNEDMIEEEPDAENIIDDDLVENMMGDKENCKEEEEDSEEIDDEDEDDEDDDEDADDDEEEEDSESEVDLNDGLDLGKRIAKEDRRIRGEPTPSKSS